MNSQVFCATAVTLLQDKILAHVIALLKSLKWLASAEIRKAPSTIFQYRVKVTIMDTKKNVVWKAGIHPIGRE